METSGDEMLLERVGDVALSQNQQEEQWTVFVGIRHAPTIVRALDDQHERRETSSSHLTIENGGARWQL